MSMVATFTTPNGYVFAFDHNPRMGSYRAVGPLIGGRSIVDINSSVRVCSYSSDRQDARKDLIRQLAAKGY